MPERTAVVRVGAWELALVPTGTETGPEQVGVHDPAGEARRLATTLARAPVAAAVLADLLTITSDAPVPAALAAESLAYSTLMAGGAHRTWLAGRRPPTIVTGATSPVLVDRSGGHVTVTLNRPERHNAFGRDVRDGLCDALDFVAVDETVTRVDLRGAGASFCSGGDLAEFGSSRDVAFAHLVRRDRSAAQRLHVVADRVTVHLHGSCIGAGIELASFAHHVVAAPDTRIRLPELAMGLVPGAGGTVGITRRIGPWRTIYLVVSGEDLPRRTALSWGLVDALAD